MVWELAPQPHPIVACAKQMNQMMGEVSELQATFVGRDDKQAALLELTEVERRLAELKLRVLATAGDVAEEAGDRDAAAWLARHTQADSATVRAEQHLAQALDKRWSRVAAGMRAGTVSVDHALVITSGLEALPAHVGADVIARAEAQLVEYAAQFRPAQLRRIARRILDVVAPEIAEGEEAKRLEQEEQRAREACRLSLKPLGDGTTRLSGLLPDADATRLRTYLEAYTSPRHDPGTGGEADRIPYRRKLGHAFCALLEHLDPARLPAHGGDATTLMVTITLDSLRNRLGTGTIVGGEPLSASAVRRLACTAGVVPVVLGGKGEILALGRTRRLYSPAQRKAMRLRDQRCRAEGCTVPAARTEAHHLHPWSKGGRTDLDDGICLCSHHHHRAHDPTWTTERLPNGDIRFHRRR